MLLVGLVVVAAVQRVDLANIRSVVRKATRALLPVTLAYALLGGMVGFVLVS